MGLGQNVLVAVWVVITAAGQNALQDGLITSDRGSFIISAILSALKRSGRQHGDYVLISNNHS